MAVRGLRGATSVESDTPAEIVAATTELLREILRVNEITEFDEIASIFFTTTPDLVGTFPAEAARHMGMTLVPLLCASEIAVPGRLTKCIRVLIHVNTDQPQAAMVHVYQREARKLRPDVQSAQ